MQCKDNWNFLNEHHGPLWRIWCCPVRRSTLTVCSALCWALFSPTCCRSGSQRWTCLTFQLLYYNSLNIFLIFILFYFLLSFDFYRDSTSSGRSSTRGHQQSEHKIFLYFSRKKYVFGCIFPVHVWGEACWTTVTFEDVWKKKAFCALLYYWVWWT